jgi:hypothetical protein
MFLLTVVQIFHNETFKIKLIYKFVAPILYPKDTDRSFSRNIGDVPHGLGTQWHSWLRHCITNLMVVGSIPDGVIRIFYWHNPSGRAMALWLTHV